MMVHLPFKLKKKSWSYFILIIYISITLSIGAPSQEFFDQPITSSDHPFLRGNVDSIRAHKMAAAGGNPALMADAEADLAERMSAMRRPGETDMDFFERRYQERVRYPK